MNVRYVIPGILTPLTLIMFLRPHRRPSQAPPTCANSGSRPAAPRCSLPLQPKIDICAHDVSRELRWILIRRSYRRTDWLSMIGQWQVAALIWLRIQIIKCLLQKHRERFSHFYWIYCYVFYSYSVYLLTDKMFNIVDLRKSRSSLWYSSFWPLDV